MPELRIATLEGSLGILQMQCCRIKRPACQLEPNFRPNSYGIPIIIKKKQK